MATLYKNAQIIDGQGNRMDGHGLLIQDDKIEQLAPLSEFDGFSGETVDLSGKTLMPGLIDCHVHLLYGAETDPVSILNKMAPGAITVRGLLHVKQMVEGGVTSVRDCGGIDYLEFAVRDACKRGEFVGPNILAAGKMICMTGGHGNRWGRVADGKDDVIRGVREQIHAGSDFIKIMATGGVMTQGVNPEDAHYSAEEIAAGIHEGHRFHKKSASHAQGAEGIMNAVKGGIDSIEHGIFMNDECLQAMLDAGTFLVPTLSAVNNIIKGADQGIPQYAVEKSIRVRESHMNAFKMFYKAGGKIAMGTDAGTPLNRHGENAQELKMMVELGITPMEAITFSTQNGAELMGIDHVGTVAAGKTADLLVVNGNPLEDISMVSNPANHHMVVKSGIPVT